MSLHRWSLPSRAYSHEKSSDSDSNRSTKFSTVHIGQPGICRRANLSGVFATLFEKNENTQNNTSPENTHLNTNQTQPLASRTENIPHTPNIKSWHVKELQTTISSDVDPPTTNDYKPWIAKWDSVPQPLWNPLCDRPITPGQTPQKHESSARINSYNLPNGEGDGNRGKEKVPLESTKSSDCLDRVRSTSSSYPTEGIHSPPDNCRSPEPTTWTQNLVSEYLRLVEYPSKELWYRSSELTNDTSAQDLDSGKGLIEELAAAGGVFVTDSRNTNQDQTNKFCLSIISPRQTVEGDIISLAQPLPGSDVVKEPDQKDHKHSSSSDCIVPILQSGGSSDPAIEVSFVSYKAPISVDTSEDDTLLKIGRFSSTDCMRPSTNTGSTSCTTIHGQSKTSKSNTMPTSVSQNMHEPAKIRSEMPLGDSGQPRSILPGSNHSSTSLVQRLQKFKFKKWVKKVCFRTKVRFEHAVKPTHFSRASVGDKHTSRKSKKGKRGRVKANRRFMVPWYDQTKTAKHERQTKKREKRPKEAHQFFSTFKINKSIQLPSTLSGGEEKHNAYHKRVQSCPAHVGL
ncbi:hypothetical protein F5X99DRAFT_424884 [Biscogniauxia marginata]|nr:hypothetical protein F5X99DRAFT_424884 [Biscogniauxia marginata]